MHGYTMSKQSTKNFNFAKYCLAVSSETPHSATAATCGSIVPRSRARQKSVALHIRRRRFNQEMKGGECVGDVLSSKSVRLKLQRGLVTLTM